MKVEQIELFIVRMPLVAPFETSGWVETEELHVLVALHTEGMTGWGECVASDRPHYSSETTNTNRHIIRDFIAPAILHMPINSVKEYVERVAWIRGNRMAKAGVESAFWDLFAQREAVSLSNLMGGTRKKIEVGVSVGLQPTPQELVKRVDQYLAEGYGRVKIKIKPGHDIDLVRAIRKEHRNLRLQVDANSAYQLEDAPVFISMDEFELLLIEQPLRYEDIYEHSKLQSQLRTPICLDESIHSLEDAATALELKACKIINIKAGRVGGFTEAIRIHDLCMKQNAPVWCGGMLETGIGRAGNVALASLPNFTLPGDLSASKRYYREDLVEPEFDVNPDGTMDVPTGIGLGVKVLSERVAKYSQERETLR